MTALSRQMKVLGLSLPGTALLREMCATEESVVTEQGSESGVELSLNAKEAYEVQNCAVKFVYLLYNVPSSWLLKAVINRVKILLR